MKQSTKVNSIRDIDFAKRKGLLPVIVQDRNTRDILMLAYANEEAVRNHHQNRECMFLEHLAQ